MADTGLSIGTLSGQISLDDKFSATINVSNEAIDKLVERFHKVDHSSHEVAEGMIIAEAAIHAVEKAAHLAAEMLKEITVEGAHVADVEDNFNRLTLSAGMLGEELVGTLAKGTHDTITDFELMKSVNDNLAAGVELTTEQYNTLATGAFALAQAKGMDVKDAFDKINDALLTGRVRGVQYLTGKIDMAKAEDDYAKKLGTTTDRLTADEKLMAARVAILDKVTASTQRLGEQTDGIDEKIAQASVRWANFTEELGAAVARSPIVLKAFDDIGRILTEAFGSDKEHMIENITHAVETAATTLVDLVEVGVNVVQFIVEWRDVLEPLLVTFVAYQVGIHGMEAATKAWAATTATAEAGVAALVTPMGVVAIAAGAMYAAFQIGKWQPISDFFEKLALRTIYQLSESEAQAAVEQHHLTDEMAHATPEMEEHARAAEEIELATQNWKEVLETINPEIAKHAEELLNAGVSAKSVATQLGLTGAQVKALQSDIIETNKVLDHNAKMLDEANGKLRISQKETEAMAEAWKNVNSIGQTWQDTLKGVPPLLQEQLVHLANLGASVKDLSAIFPELTKAQVEAAVEGRKAADEVEKVWTQTFEITAKMHGDNINDWVMLETRKYDATIRMLQQQGKATQDMLDAERAKFEATVNAEIQKREEQIETSKAHYEKEVRDAQARLDLMMKNSRDFVAEDIRLAQQQLNEKQRLLGTWAQDAKEKLSDNTEHTKRELAVQENAIGSLAQKWAIMGGAIDANTEKVRTLSGEVLTLKEYEARQLMGGSQQVTSSNLREKIADVVTGYSPSGSKFYRDLDPDQAVKLAKQGYSFEQIVHILKGGEKPDVPGPAIPGFASASSTTKPSVTYPAGTTSGTTSVASTSTTSRTASTTKSFAAGTGSIGTPINLTFNVNGTGQQVAEQTKNYIMGDLMLRTPIYGR